jgi:cholesterol transport system auxiliary component
LNKTGIIILCSIFWLLTACTPVQNVIVNQYKLETFSSKKITNKRTSLTLLVSQPDAIPGYQTEQMLYINKPFEINNFAHNAWISSPANMLYPLITQSLQSSHYFYAVASGPDADKTDYRLDTQLIELQQNFLTKPSRIELVANVVLTHIDDNRVVASRIIGKQVSCPEDTPYGGVVAANRAAFAFTAELTGFVITQVKRDT